MLRFSDHLKLSLVKILFNYKDQNYLERARLLVSLGSYYSNKDTDAEVMSEIQKLSDILLELELLRNYTEKLEYLTEEELVIQPDLLVTENPEGLAEIVDMTLPECPLLEELQDEEVSSPALKSDNPENSLPSLLFKEIEKLRKEIGQKNINIGLITSFIATRAKESFDLSDRRIFPGSTEK